MIRHAEAVLAGHPDKFADQIADRIIEEAYRFDNEAYGQIEVGVWSDRIWLNGGIATRQPFATPLRDLIIEVGKNIGYTKDNHIDVEKYHILCTLQHQETTPLMDLSLAITEILSRAYGRLQEEDKRWCRPWRDVELLINPNGPLIEAGSDGDNGQTGRKLVMDYYGPRVPIGGGALSGKHLSHVDRAGAYAARRAALDAVLSGAHSCQVTLAYAPNLNAPLDVCYAMEGRGDRWASEAFNHDEIRALSADCRAVGPLGAGGHFFDQIPSMELS
jgi:S-adenosylmethionine synthetase